MKTIVLVYFIFVTVCGKRDLTLITAVMGTIDCNLSYIYTSSRGSLYITARIFDITARIFSHHREDGFISLLRSFDILAKKKISPLLS